MKKMILKCVLGLLCFNFPVFAQKQTKTGLQPGDIVPRISLSNLFNVNGPSIDLSTIQGQVVILDFWATWCSNCIHEFPKESLLQKEFPGKLQILLVNSKSTGDTRQKIGLFLKTQQPAVQMPVVCEDTQLKPLFPHFGLPHYVWLYRGKVAAITGPEEVNSENIRKLLNTGFLSGRVKKDLPFPKGEPFFPVITEDTSVRPIYQSILTGYLPDRHSRAGFELLKNQSGSHLYGVNLTRLSLYQLAFPEFSGFPANQIRYDNNNIEKLSIDEHSLQWKKDNLFSYELVMRAMSKDSLRRQMQTDLKRTIPLQITIKQEQCNVWVITLTEQALTPDQPGEPSTNITETMNQKRVFEHLPLINLVNQLNVIQPTPVIDDTHYDGNITLQLPDDLTNIKALNAALSKEGFQIKASSRNLPILYISNPTNKLPTTHPES